MSQTLVFKNARVFDGVNGDCAEGINVVVADGLIQELTTTAPKVADARVVDVAGRTLMPGMIDCHVHPFASDSVVQKMEGWGEAYRTAHAVRMLQFALQCGFTAVRDIGGGSFSMAKALADKLFEGPRYFYSGKILTMTGGHGDFRQVEEAPRYRALCACAGTVFNCCAVVADGVDECIKMTREELRQGAHFIKIMGSGGVISPTDPIWMNQYREDEIRAIVNECTERRTYVAAHCHPAAAVRRCVEFGVRSIEHATLIDDETAKFVAQRGAYIVPTLIIVEQLVQMGRSIGFAPQSQEKADHAWMSAVSGLDKMRNAGVKVCFGTDLLGELYRQQCREFALRKQVFSPLEILRQATSVSAEMMMQEGRLGCVRAGAHADLLVVDGDPLKDISLLEANGENLSVICRAGELVKNRLG
ncbi:amidohydrolase family protein [Ramlibacter solisilvae]|uniref:Amidohydrolase n=1 Tax=Ramlibacter tataouinensis TaxID=94132 RepID=A0A127JUG9_9BURK|nr:amidohydrolase family protein [Ramlibacter tataouinensis]AMO23646.1 amidohydrolase [Ramlibacter tataouinensis]